MDHAALVEQLAERMFKGIGHYHPKLTFQAANEDHRELFRNYARIAIETLEGAGWVEIPE